MGRRRLPSTAFLIVGLAPALAHADAASSEPAALEESTSREDAAEESGPRESAPPEMPAPATAATANANAPEARTAQRSEARRWVFVSFRQDLAWVEGDHVCSPEVQRSGDFSCFRANGTQYLGTPRSEDAASASGLSVATTRLLATYQHSVGTHWSVGAVVGLVLRGGGPRPVGRDAREFFPFHLEGQLSWWPSGAPARGEGPSPFLLLGGGLAQIDSRFSLAVREDPRAPLPPSQLDNPERQTLDVYKKSGTGFVGLGGGIAASTSSSLLWRLALEAMGSFPAFGIGAGLEAGVGFDL